MGGGDTQARATEHGAGLIGRVRVKVWTRVRLEVGGVCGVKV